jgi:hypothetical protein
MPAKKPKTTNANKGKSSIEKKATSRSRAKKTVDSVPLMTAQASATGTRRNKSGSITRTNRFTNIDEGMVPFNYSLGAYGKSSTNLDVRDTVILCQKAYYNFSVFRNTIDLMTELSVSDIYLTGGSKKSKAFFNAFFKKINLKSLLDRFFREYYRSGNVFMYRFEKNISREDVKKLTQTYAASSLKKISMPVRYAILNPADIQASGNMSFSSSTFYKVLNPYEIMRLKNPQTDEDHEILESLPKEAIEQLKRQGSKNNAILTMPLDPNKITAVFYKKQDYEPFGVPMGYPVLEDINWKAEMKKMDMALTRTMQQMILLVTMGTEPDKGGVNQKNLAAMQSLFENESIGRVLIADYTTKAEFVIPKIADLLDPKKYEVVDRDIQMGLNNVLVGSEKFANQSAKTDVFIARLRQARQTFINDFLMPEIKSMAKTLGFRNYPTAVFEDIKLKDPYNNNRIYSRLIELGILTPEEGMEALQTGRLPSKEESIESQKEYMDYKDDGLFVPIAQNQNLQEGGTQSGSGRPDGTSSPQNTKTVTPIGESEAKKVFSLEAIKDNMILAEKLSKKIEAELKKKHGLEELSKNQLNIASQISDIIIVNEEPKSWIKKVKSYVAKPVDKNPDRVKRVQSIAAKHQVDEYLAGILYASEK